jgi:hypothetical protein
MIPVVMLVINTGALSFDFLTLFCLTYGPSIYSTYFSHLPDGGCSSGCRVECPVLSRFPHPYGQWHLIGSFGTFLVNQHLCNLPHSSQGMVRTSIVSLAKFLFTAPWLTTRCSHTYRRYRKLLKENGVGIRTPRQAIRILAVLVESGMIYILIGVSSSWCSCEGCHDFSFVFRSRSWPLSPFLIGSEMYLFLG